MKKIIFFTIILISLFSCDAFRDENDNASDKLTGKFISDNFPGKYLEAMTLDSKENLWLSTSEIDTSIHLPSFSSSLPIKHYLSRFSTDAFEILDNNFVGAKKMTIDKNDKLWFITSNTVYCFNDQKPVEIFKLSTDMGSFNWITSDQNNDIWACGLGTPLIKIIQNPEIKIVNITNGIISSTAGHFDKNNNLWIALWTKWIGKLDPNGEWTYYNPSNSSILDQNYWCITSDKDDNIWAGTGSLNNNASNLIMFDGINWKQIAPKDEKGNRIYGTVRQLYYDGKKIWIVSDVAVNSAFDSNYLITFDGVIWNRIYEAPLKDGISDIELDLLHDRALIGTLNSGIVQSSIK